MPFWSRGLCYEKELTTRIRGSQKKKKTTAPFRLLLSKFTKTYLCQKTYKKTANKRFHYISDPSEVLIRDFEIPIYLASKNLNSLNIPSTHAFTIACTNQAKTSSTARKQKLTR